MRNSVDTVNAAATAIVAAETRVQPTSVEKRRWGSWWSAYWCFGSHRSGKRIGHAALVPEATVAAGSGNQTTALISFAAPPSSPASFLQSEPQSSTQSPGGLLSLNVYSPGPNSIFAIGPYAHETQLVSPPVFSTFTTEASTAPFTPPPESRHQTTPSSPEVPFAQLLSSSLDASRRNKFAPSHYEFQSYYLYPGSPVGHLISPSSVINSGTSSPFVDQELASRGHPFLEFRTGEQPPKLWSIDGISTHKWEPYQGSGAYLTPDAGGPSFRDGFLRDHPISDVASLANSDSGSPNNGGVFDHRVSFELTAKDAVVYCPDKQLLSSVAESLSMGATYKRDGNCNMTMGNHKGNASSLESGNDNGESVHVHGQEPILTTMGSVKEFKFVNPDEETSDKPTLNSDWWANEKVVTNETGPNSWTFFPMIQPGVS